MGWKPDICIYHGNCDDGFGAAWAIWRRWGNEVAYVPGAYGKSLPDDALVKEGEIVLRAHMVNVAKFAAEAYDDVIDGHHVPVANVPYHYASDTAHALLSIYPAAPFTACWFRRKDGMIQYSLRSEDQRADVSEIATKFGGGGHRNAAGYQVQP